MSKRLNVSANREPGFYTVQDVRELLGVSDTTARNLMRAARAEIKARGGIVLKGKIQAKFFRTMMAMDTVFRA